MRIAIGADHGGFELKRALVAALPGIDFIDKGTDAAESCDYPDYADAVAEAVAIGDAEFGVLVCTTGMGMSMAANRFQNVRAALCRDEEDARIARAHNGANVLCLGQKRTDAAVAAGILKAFVDRKSVV